MLKNFLVTLVTLLIVVQPTLSIANPSGMKFKNVSISVTEDDKIQIQQGKDVAVIENLGNQRFKLNGSLFVILPTDTPEVAMDKIKKAHKASLKKNALIESLFIEKANALPPLWFSLLFGGMIGAGIGRATCPSEASQGGNFGAPATN